jgi:hypothetical protein
MVLKKVSTNLGKKSLVQKYIQGMKNVDAVFKTELIK